MTVLAIFQNIGMPELIIVLAIALLLFGRRLPEVGRSIGRGISEFKKGLSETQEEIKKGVDEDKSKDDDKKS